MPYRGALGGEAADRLGGKAADCVRSAQAPIDWAFYPLTAPAPQPATRYFWMWMNTTITGMMISMPPDMIMPQSITVAL